MKMSSYPVQLLAQSHGQFCVSARVRNGRFCDNGNMHVPIGGTLAAVPSRDDGDVPFHAVRRFGAPLKEIKPSTAPQKSLFRLRHDVQCTSDWELDALSLMVFSLSSSLAKISSLNPLSSLHSLAAAISSGYSATESRHFFARSERAGSLSAIARSAVLTRLLSAPATFFLTFLMLGPSFSIIHFIFRRILIFEHLNFEPCYCFPAVNWATFSLNLAFFFPTDS